MEKAVIGKRLRKLRGKMTRRQLGRAVGITPQAVYNYENGMRIPSDDIKVKLANFFGKTVQDIFFS